MKVLLRNQNLYVNNSRGLKSQTNSSPASTCVQVNNFTMGEELRPEKEFLQQMYDRGIKIIGMENGEYIFVTHVNVSREDVDTVINTVKELILG